MLNTEMVNGSEVCNVACSQSHWWVGDKVCSTLDIHAMIMTLLSPVSNEIFLPPRMSDTYAPPRTPDFSPAILSRIYV